MDITQSQFDDLISFDISLHLLFFSSIEVPKQSNLVCYDDIFTAFSFFLMLITLSLPF